MEWFNQITEGPWWVDISAVASAIVAIGIILRMVIWPGIRAFWKAIVAAPQIAAGVGRLVELLETDIMHRVEVLELKEEAYALHINEIDAHLSGEKARMNAHDKRADATEVRLSILEELYKQLTSKIG